MHAPLHGCLPAKALIPKILQKGSWLASAPRSSSSPLLAVQKPLQKLILSTVLLGSNCWLFCFPHLWWEQQTQLSSFSSHGGHINACVHHTRPHSDKDITMTLCFTMTCKYSAGCMKPPGKILIYPVIDQCSCPQESTEI